LNTSVNLCGITLSNPIIPASGTFGYGREFAELYDINCLGTFSCKGTTAQPRLGNPTPRIAEGNCGMLNSVGLQNPGIDAVVSEELPALEKIFHKPIIANVCGFSVEEYVQVAQKFDACKQVGWLELNISCPNVHGGGMGFGTSCESAAEVTAAVKALIKTRKEGYPPTVGEVSEKVAELTRPDELTRTEAWSLVSKACRNGIYGAEEEFARLPPLVRKTVGTPNQLREWAMMDAVTFSVAGSHFQRSFEILQKREREAALLPEAFRERLSALTAGLLSGDGG
jgi:hypothetical protein